MKIFQIIIKTLCASLFFIFCGLEGQSKNFGGALILALLGIICLLHGAMQNDD